MILTGDSQSLTPPDINTLLEDPEKLLGLSNEQLTKLLEPYFPYTRTPVLPEEKARKTGVDHRFVQSEIDKYAEQLKQLKGLR